MNIIYIPHRGTFNECFDSIGLFLNIEEMLKFLVKYHNGAFDINYIFISYYGFDPHLNLFTYIVTVARFQKDNYLKKYKYPQCIGYCFFINENKKLKEMISNGSNVKDALKRLNDGNN